jgi:hypothetical protein
MAFAVPQTERCAKRESWLCPGVCIFWRAGVDERTWRARIKGTLRAAHTYRMSMAARHPHRAAYAGFGQWRACAREC